MRKLTAVALTTVSLLGLAASAGTSVGAGAQPTSRNVLILGTSTTEGMGATPASSRYASLVASARPGDRFTIVGRGGTTLADPATANWLDYRVPGGQDVVVLQFGFNEWNRSTPAGTFQGWLTDFITRVRAVNPNATVIVLSAWISQYDAATPDLRQELWQRYGAAVEAALRATGGGTHVDANPTGSRREAAPYAWQAPGTPGYDGLHYNNAGHRKLADLLLATLARLDATTARR